MPLYKADPNNSNKQIPDTQGNNRYDRAVNPVHCKAKKTPSYVLVNATMVDSCSFYFGSSASFSDLGASGRTNPVNFTTMGEDLTAGTKLHIHPTAWSGSAADNGKITFVYKSGLATGGF